ncbi:MAG: flagellar hook-length control protein FliK [Pseudomonadota bacterium]
MIEGQQIQTPNAAAREPRAPSRQEPGPGFDFGAAVAALESRAAQALETHGGAPGTSTSIGESGAAPTDAHRNAKTANAGLQERARGQTTPQNDGPLNQPQQQADRVNGEARVSQANSTAQVAAPVAAAPIANATAATAALTQNLAGALKPDAGLARLAEARPSSMTSAPKAPAQPAPPFSQTTAEDFAKLLARRLETGGTHFELRLDPPSLGRIEATMRLGDDGENTLALKFETQAALEKFSLDEATLRTMLASSGFEFGRDRLEFALQDFDEAYASQSEADANQSHSGVVLYSLTPWSTGAIDITA